MEYTVNSLDFQMAMDSLTNRDEKSFRVLFARGDFVFTAAALSLVAGFLLPIPLRVLDVLWVCGLCLSAAVLLIALSGKDSGELSAFPLVLVGTAGLKIVLTATSAKLIFLKGSGGTVLDGVGGFLVKGNTVWAAVISVLIAVVVVMVVQQAIRRIRRTAVKYASEILPLKNISVETDLNIGSVYFMDPQDVALYKKNNEAWRHIRLPGPVRHHGRDDPGFS